MVRSWSASVAPTMGASAMQSSGIVTGAAPASVRSTAITNAVATSANELSAETVFRQRIPTPPVRDDSPVTR